MVLQRFSPTQLVVSGAWQSWMVTASWFQAVILKGSSQGFSVVSLEVSTWTWWWVYVKARCRVPVPWLIVSNLATLTSCGVAVLPWLSVLAFRVPNSPPSFFYSNGEDSYCGPFQTIYRWGLVGKFNWGKVLILTQPRLRVSWLMLVHAGCSSCPPPKIHFYTVFGGPKLLQGLTRHWPWGLPQISYEMGVPRKLSKKKTWKSASSTLILTPITKVQQRKLISVVYSQSHCFGQYLSFMTAQNHKPNGKSRALLTKMCC